MDFSNILNFGENQLMQFLKKFNIENSKCFQFDFISISDKKNIFIKLMNIISNESYTSELKNECLNTIKIMSRDKTNLDQTIDNNLIGIIIAITRSDAHDFANLTEACKCLCNIVFNSQSAQKFISQSNFINLFIQRLEIYDKYPLEIKYYDMRLLFIITAFCSNTRSQLYIVIPKLTEILSKRLKDDISNYPNYHTLQVEVLKLLFNITMELHNDNQPDHTNGNESSTDTNVISDSDIYILGTNCNLIQHHKVYCQLTTVITRLLIDADVNDELVSHIVNLLTNLPSHCFVHLIYIYDNDVGDNNLQICSQNGMDDNAGIELCCEIDNKLKRINNELIRKCDNENVLNDKNRVDVNGKLRNLVNLETISKLIQFLHLRLETTTASNQAECLSPILKCLSCLCLSQPPIRRYCRKEILPHLGIEVRQLPEEGKTLRNRLCKLLTSHSQNVKDLAADLLFILCKESVSRFVKYTGYGNAAGLLAQRGLMMGGRPTDNQYSSSSDSDTEEYKQLKDSVNPVTGCWEEKKVDALLNEMSTEQKEFEALKLINQIQRLSSDGMIQPMSIGADGKPVPIQHVSQLINNSKIDSDSSDSD